MKKIVALALALAMVLGLAGCGSEPTPAETGSGGTTALATSGQNVVQTAVPLLAGDQLASGRTTAWMSAARITCPALPSWRPTRPATGRSAGSAPPPPSPAS